ncbi:MAG: hypothetical protein Q7Q71_07135 [Verrucomicrobiota bacterium JB023]|nr:hypothetical protein [Verrucomicrobiota bacterium JB023]
MLATVIVDTYSAGKAEFLADALEEVASAKDNYGWSSSGVYCFWDPSTREILYIGLAVDLATRFRQHNDLVDCPPTCCKRSKIEDFFKTNALLGYSVLVQSTLSQAACSRWEKANPEKLESLRKRYELVDREEAKRLLNADVDQEIRTYEGALIEAFEVCTGAIPQWNKINGANIRFTEEQLRTATYLLKSFIAGHDWMDPLAAHVRLRDLFANAMFQGYEELLHGVRLLVLGGCPFKEAIKKTPDPLDYFEKMRSEGYLDRQVKL